MTDDADFARQVADCGDRIAQRLHATGEMLTTIQQGLDAQAPFLAASKLIVDAILVDIASRDPEAIERIAGLVAPALDRQHPAVADAAAQMLGEALDLAALGAADGGRPQ